MNVMIIKGVIYEETKGRSFNDFMADTPNKPELGFDGQNLIIKMALDKPVHEDWNCISEKGEITCPINIQRKCMEEDGLAPCIVGFVDLKE